VIPSFDIFRIEPGGRVSWVRTAGTREDALAHVQKLAKLARSGYVIGDMQTGERLIVAPGSMPVADPEVAPEEPRFPAWEKPYRDALKNQDDRGGLPGKVAAAETAIFGRLQELRSTSDGSAERLAIEEAASVLLVLKSVKLNYPDPRAAGSS
jgi:hypothetical protein